ncbi:IclR family transcriptional regulator C-terminal domain-containing protein [Variovorax sp. J31P207]|uniref:IclR family transcriptional regulator domain-containing protein n=1 Tax=Variovorax sp. J31P207 TaxID=3053510 RepID=UPI0025752995|nr:IclR family transcriptional regulator C-terminal domain-containing protein [Variovorax sp. J31P207]MDM0069330.1 IclR family transcriptional regulator C-terminal domain-containing protein [Variovorax sp. J31P207]
MRFDEPDSDNGLKTVAALQRGLAVLRTVIASPAATFTELLHETGLSKATLGRMLKTLELEGWIHRHERSGRYSARPDATASPHRIAWHRKLSDVAAPYRARLQRQIPWPTDLCVRDGRSMLSIDGPYQGHGLSANFGVLGSRPAMLRSSVGRCYLAFCADDERESILRALARSRAEEDHAGLRADELDRMIVQVRQQRYATRYAGHLSPHSPEQFGALAVPIFQRNAVVAALAVVWVPALMQEDQIVATCLPSLRTAAEGIGRRLRVALPLRDA